MNGYDRGLAAVMAGVLAVAVATPTPVLANKKEAAAVGALIGLAVGAAAVGAAAYGAYYRPPPPACGYYPYPPCY
mgnify:CR=1 FL=1